MVLKHLNVINVILINIAGLTTNPMVSVAPLAQMNVTGSITAPVSSIGNFYRRTQFH